MSISAFDAAAAYGRVFDTRGLQSAPDAASADAIPAGGGFGGMVEALVTSTATNMRAAETASVRQIAGQGDLVDVATAIGAAEAALDTLVAVRDRVVNAYSEIMRMQI